MKTTMRWLIVALVIGLVWEHGTSQTPIKPTPRPELTLRWLSAVNTQQDDYGRRVGGRGHHRDCSSAAFCAQ